MPITTQWWVFADAIIESEQEAPGVYELGNAAGEVIYIGSSTALRHRLKEHWNEPDTSCVKTKASQYRVEYRDNHVARELELSEEYVRTHGGRPPCNTGKS